MDNIEILTQLKKYKGFKDPDTRYSNVIIFYTHAYNSKIRPNELRVLGVHFTAAAGSRLNSRIADLSPNYSYYKREFLVVSMSEYSSFYHEQIKGKSNMSDPKEHPVYCVWSPDNNSFKGFKIKEEAYRYATDKATLSPSKKFVIYKAMSLVEQPVNIVVNDYVEPVAEDNQLNG